jgi:hypothetical protein
LKYFGLPETNATFRGFQVVSPSQRTKAFLVREHTNPRVLDILFVDLAPSGAGYFYSAAINGRMVKGVYFDDRPEPFSDAERQFEREREFWYSWLRDNQPRQPLN